MQRKEGQEQREGGSESLSRRVIEREEVEELHIFLCNTRISVNCTPESAKPAQRYSVLVVRDDSVGRWQLSVAVVPCPDFC